MSEDKIDGPTDEMLRFSSNLVGSFGPMANPIRKTMVRPLSPPCGGLLECGELFEADNHSTEQLHKFITQLTQGFAAYSSFVRRSAVEYLAADDGGRKALLAALDERRGAGLPEIDPRLEQPAAPRPE